MAEWSFLTNHARALLLLAGDPTARLRDVAAALEVTERTAYKIVADLSESGYVEKVRDGRRNHYRVQTDAALADPIVTERTIGELLHLLAEGATAPRRS